MELDDNFLSKHLYGKSHPMIGKPCLYNDGDKLRYALPYGAYEIGEGARSHVNSDMIGVTLLSIAYYAPDLDFEGKDVHVKALSAVKPSKLIPIEPNSKLALQISHTILSWLVDNRDNTFNSRERQRSRESRLASA